MARAGTARHRGRNTQGHSEGGDDVQRSLELLDRVLSEFDDIENANQMLQQQALLGGGTTTVVTTASSGVEVVTHQETNNPTNAKGVVIDVTKRHIDPGNTGGGGNVSSTPEDDSPSLGGHQSEDDGYMSMNGRKAKFALSFNPVNEVIMQQQELLPAVRPSNGTTNNSSSTCCDSNIILPPTTQQPTTTIVEMDFPPPPEEAERLIATLLPRVSPGNSAKRSVGRRKNNNKTRTEILTSPLSQFHKYNVEYLVNGDDPAITAATQTTLPQTRHSRPYGWEKSNSEGFQLHQINPKKMGQRYGSLQYDSRNPPAPNPLNIPRWVPPRTVPGASDRHREVCRRRVESEENLTSNTDIDDNAPTSLRPLSELADDEHFSDDSLEETLPPPPPSACSKRSSIAWEVSIGDDDPLLTPGSTKVVRRRRRKSGDQSHSSTSSIPNRLRDLDDWPDPPPCSTEDEIVSPFSDSDDPVILPDDVHSSDFSNSGTYVIRRGRKERKPLHNVSMSPNSNLSLNSRLSSDLSIPHSRYSGTDWNNSSIFSRELITPNSRISIDLSTPNSRISQELNSPKSRYSLDLNISRDSPHHQHHYHHSSSRRSSDPNYSRSSTPSRGHEFKKHSTTFDNFKSLIKEGVIESYSPPEDELPMMFNDQMPPNLVRVVSLPTLSADEFTPRRELTVTVEEEEDIESPRQTSMSPLRKIEENISSLLERRDLDVTKLRLEDRNYKDTLQLKLNSHLSHHKNHIEMIVPDIPRYDIQKSSSNSEIRKQNRKETNDGGTPSKPKRNGIQKSESAKEMLLSHLPDMEEPAWTLTNSNSVDFPVRVEILQHEFPPLPPSPVEEDEDEYQEIANPAQKRADTLPITSEPPAIPPHREPITNSLKTRSMDAEFSRGYRNNYSGRQTPSERRTLPTELPGTRRRTFLKRSSQSPREEHHMQTSCSLPETPIFARGCDIPRTPHRRAPDVPTLGSSRTAPRQSSTMGTLNTIGTTGYRRGISSTGLEQAMVGAELLRLAGGPGRGWYPRHRQHPRPASIEHLDRLAPGHLGSNPWDCNSKKPLTLPPNLTPKFYQRSPREALRRVTSLLIRKGNNGKENSKKDKDTLSPSGNSVNGGDEGQKKKGFFKSFWKRSRHYSLEQ